MKRLVFIDDDRSELADCGEILGNAYDYIPVHWPSESAKLFNGPVPDIFVSDLYLPRKRRQRTYGIAARRSHQIIKRCYGALFRGCSKSELER